MMGGSVWKIALVGHDSDFRGASLVFDSAELRVSQTNDEYFLALCRTVTWSYTPPQLLRLTEAALR
jgi:hypothetical protein